MSAPPADPVLEVGRVRRAHGVRGDVVVELITDRTERLAPGSRLLTDAAELVVESSRPFGTGFLVRFEGVADRTAAGSLRGAALRAPALGTEEGLWVHQLVGCTVIDQGGVERGLVEAVEANPAADLLVLDDGRLVPVGFVTDAVVAARRLYVDVPPGLFD